jgi:hypothetical protein
MFLRETQKRRVEQIAQEMGLSCSECGSTALEAYEAEWLLGGTLDAYLECSNCWKENSLELPPEEARDCGFDPDDGLPYMYETGL